jgi:hypothetical protein
VSNWRTYRLMFSFSSKAMEAPHMFVAILESELIENCGSRSLWRELRTSSLWVVTVRELHVYSWCRVRNVFEKHLDALVCFRSIHAGPARSNAMNKRFCSAKCREWKNPFPQTPYMGNSGPRRKVKELL